jgi:lambda repressor-like predicted transcriptional regulator
MVAQEVSVRPAIRRVADVMVRQGISLATLIARSGLDDRIVSAIVHQRYLPSPRQRRLVARVLHVHRDELWWGHEHQVDQLSGPS